jgi:alkylhydroperoxidase family enzyme
MEMQPLTADQVDPSLRDDVDLIVQWYGQLPHLYGVMAHSPPVMKAMWHLGIAAFVGGVVDEDVKRAAAIVTCEAVGSRYLLAGQTYAIYKAGWSRDEVRGLRSGDYPERATPLVRAACDLARRAAVDVTGGCTEQLAALRDAGADEAAIAELLGVIGFIRFNATFAEPLALDPDPKVSSS